MDHTYYQSKIRTGKGLLRTTGKYKLPITYFTSILGSCINATIKLWGTRKWFSDDSELYYCRNPILMSPAAASMSFDNFSLPQSKTLRRLFPPTVIPPESEDQDEDGLSVLPESNPSDL